MSLGDGREQREVELACFGAGSPAVAEIEPAQRIGSDRGARSRADALPTSSSVLTLSRCLVSSIQPPAGRASRLHINISYIASKRRITVSWSPEPQVAMVRY